MENNEITIHDIAHILGIDSSTVSRALNDSPRVAKKTKEKIITKAKELGYERNHLASNLRKSKTFTLGVIVPRISRHFFASAIAGIEETAYKAGYNVIICQTMESLEREKRIINTLLANRVDGVLISISMETENYDHLQDLKKRNIPYVFFDRHFNIPGNSNVVVNDFEAAFTAVEHLILNKSKNIVHFAGPQNLEIYINRLKGYKAALNKYKIPYREEFVIISKLMQKDGIKNTKKILDLSANVDGIFCANDVIAISTIQYLKSKNIKIPEEIAIVGFNNETIAAVIEPALTTINQPGVKIGVTAADLLLDKIANKIKRNSSETIYVDTELIIRNSSKRVK